MTPSKDRRMDILLAMLVLALVAFGVVMVYSASAVFAGARYHSGSFFLLRQAAYAGVAIGVMFLIARIDYRRLEALTYPILCVALALLVAVVIGFGRSVGGATRWIHLGAVNIQPAEVSKVALVFWLAYSLSRKQEHIKSFKIGLLPHVLVAGVFMLLCLKQPDFGSAVVLGLLTFLLLFVAGARLGYMLGGLCLAVPVVYWLVAGSEYRMRRIRGFLAPFEHRRDVGYQISESLMSFGSGGVTGVGMGDSRQKLFFLPEAHTDFISAIIGEELGFVGVFSLIVAFAFLIFRGVRIALAAKDSYGTYVAFGITMLLGIQAFTNLAVAMGLLPTKGLVLPFISYGGSALVTDCAAVGVLLSISRGSMLNAPEIVQVHRDARRDSGHRNMRMGTAS